MKIHNKKSKQKHGWAYWGDFGEIDVGISWGEIDSERFESDSLHYHREGVVYLITIQGEGLVEINGSKVTMTHDQVVQIDPGEQYRHLTPNQLPHRWITICTNKDPQDKVVVGS